MYRNSMGLKAKKHLAQCMLTCEDRISRSLTLFSSWARRLSVSALLAYSNKKHGFFEFFSIYTFSTKGTVGLK